MNESDLKFGNLITHSCGELVWAIHFYKELTELLKAENEDLTKKLNSALGELGYPVPGDTPTGLYKCGMCEARYFEDECKRFKDDFDKE